MTGYKGDFLSDWKVSPKPDQDFERNLFIAREKTDRD